MLTSICLILRRGSFATVFKGVLVSDEQVKVAIKEINIRTLGKQQLQDLNMEMNILSQLDHESIMEIYAVYTLPDKLFMVTEYLRGGELLTAICKRDHYHERDARRVMWQVTSALQYMHARRVIHRDIKPMNLILTERTLDSPVKIADFGFAAIDSDEIRRPGRFLCGTPGYIAPEVLTYRSYSTKVDMWSLGIVLYVLLSGYMPFPTDENGEEHVKRGRIVFPPARFARVSHGAKDLIQRLLMVDPEQRLSATQVLQHPWMQLYVHERQRLQAMQQQQQQRPLNRLMSNAVPSAIPSSSNAHPVPSLPPSRRSSSRRSSNTSSCGGVTSRRDSGRSQQEVAQGEPSGDNSCWSATMPPPPNSMMHVHDEGNDDGEDDYEVEDGEDVEYEGEEDGDLSENLEWLRQYHANEHHPPTFAGRLWRTFRSKLISTSSPGQSQIFLRDGSPSMDGTTARQLSREQQHQDILVALSERELQRQFEMYQEKEALKSRPSPSLEKQQPPMVTDEKLHVQLPSLVDHKVVSSRSEQQQQPSDDTHHLTSSPDVLQRSRTPSVASLRRPSDVAADLAAKILIHGPDHDNVTATPSAANVNATPRRLPPLVASLLSPASPPAGPSSTGTTNSGAIVAKLPKVARKYSENNGPHSGRSTSSNAESLYHPPQTLLAYTR